MAHVAQGAVRALLFLQLTPAAADKQRVRVEEQAAAQAYFRLTKDTSSKVWFEDDSNDDVLLTKYHRVKRDCAVFIPVQLQAAALTQQRDIDLDGACLVFENAVHVQYVTFRGTYMHRCFMCMVQLPHACL